MQSAQCKPLIHLLKGFTCTCAVRERVNYVPSLEDTLVEVKHRVSPSSLSLPLIMKMDQEI